MWVNSISWCISRLPTKEPLTSGTEEHLPVFLRLPTDHTAHIFLNTTEVLPHRSTGHADAKGRPLKPTRTARADPPFTAHTLTPLPITADVLQARFVFTVPGLTSYTPTQHLIAPDAMHPIGGKRQRSTAVTILHIHHRPLRSPHSCTA